MNRTYIITIIFSIWTIPGISVEQIVPHYIPQAPEAQSMARTIDIPVNYYTGIPDISIPLYEIKVGTLSVPLTLSYIGGGIRANQEATKVGLGWNLNVGGSITRTVNCADDFLEYGEGNFVRGFFNSNSQHWLEKSDPTIRVDNYYYIRQTFHEVLDGTDLELTTFSWQLVSDSEPDLYYYSIPTASGKFTYKKDKSIIFMDKSDNVCIGKQFGPNSNLCWLTDSKGVAYHFGEKEKTINYSVSRFLIPHECQSINQVKEGVDCGYEALDKTSEYTSTWLLTEMISPTNDTIVFEYEDENYQLPMHENGIYRTFLSGESETFGQFFYKPKMEKNADGPEYSQTKTEIQGKRLTKIRWRGGYALFITGKERKDLRGTSGKSPVPLSSIEVYDSNNTLKAKWTFSYGYFNNEAKGYTEHLFKRLKLESIHNALENKNWIFNYYDSIPLPVKNTKNTDYWGYYNGIDQGATYYSEGADRKANEEYAIAGSLKSITHPTGGTTQFVWESNVLKEGTQTTTLIEAQDPIIEGFLTTKDSVDTKTVIMHKTTKIYLDYYCLNLGSVNKKPIGNPFKIIKMNGDGTNSIVFLGSVKAYGSYDGKNEEITLSPGSYQFRCEAADTNVLYKMYFIDSRHTGQIRRESSFFICDERPQFNDSVLNVWNTNNKFRVYLLSEDSIENRSKESFVVSKWNANKQIFEKTMSWSDSLCKGPTEDLYSNPIDFCIENGRYQFHVGGDDGIVRAAECYSGDIEYKKPAYKNLDYELEFDIYRGDSYGYDVYDYCDEEQTDTIMLSESEWWHIDLSYEYLGQETPIRTDEQMFWIEKMNKDGEFENCINISQSSIKSYDDKSREEILCWLDSGIYVFRCKAVTDGMYYAVFSGPLNRKSKDPKADKEKRRATLLGGLRIAKIEGEKNIQYKYEGGTALVQPCKSYVETREVYSQAGSEFQISHYYSDCYQIYTYKINTSESVRPLSTLKNGNMFGYSKVIEEFEDGSRCEYSYHCEAEPLQENGEDEDRYILYKKSEVDWENGLLLSKTSYDKDGNVISITQNDYTLFTTTDRDTLGFVEAGVMNPYYYYVEVKCPKLSCTKTTEILQNGEYSTKKLIQYNKNLLLSEEETIVGSDRHSCKYRYADDFSDEVSVRMSEYMNMVGVPMEQIALRNGVIYDGTRTVYGEFKHLSSATNTATIGTSNVDENWLGMFLPHYILTVNTDKPLSDVQECKFDTAIVYNSYTKYGNPQELIYKGTPITYLWGYRDQFPLAELSNVTFEESVSHLSEQKIAYMNNSMYYEDPEFLIEQIRNSFTMLKDKSVKLCLYNPLIGPEVLVDERGQMNRYVYDKAGRLSRISTAGYCDNSGWVNEVLQQFDYNTSENYVKTKTLNGSKEKQSILSVQFYDQWGRPSMTASQGLSPQGTFSYSMQTYDVLGRSDKTWIMAPSNLASIRKMQPEEFRALSEVAFGDSCGYEQTSYDALNRPVRKTLAGTSWRNKETKTDYLTNKEREVKLYSISGNTVCSTSFYPAGTLTCTAVIDPDGLTHKTYKDLFGNVILDRRGGNADTYYIYDDCNRMRFVLSPMFQVVPDLDKFAYQYRYDGKGNNIWKQLPGCEQEERWYDSRDRLCKLQDGLLRRQNKYRVFDYDDLNRLKRQSLGNETDASNEKYEIVNFYDNYDFLDEYSDFLPDNVSFFKPKDWFYAAGQLSGQLQKASNGDDLLTIFEYEEFGRLKIKTEIGLDQSVSIRSYSYQTPTGEPELEEFKQYQYDKATEELTLQYLGQIENKYDIPHTKLLHSSVITINDIANGKTMTDTISSLTYDEFGRMVANDRSGTAGDMSYEYDKLHGWLTETTAKGGFEQTLLRETGARECRFNGSIAAMEWKCGKDIKRRYDYVYDGLNRLDYAHYSSYQADWAQTKAGASPTMRLIPGDWRNGDYSVCYNYDKNSNLLEAERQGWAYVDEDGNDVYDTVDDVMIEYNGNQRKSATLFTVTDDDYYGKMTFVNGVEKSVEYAYDGNGNLTRDDNKGITKIEYDLLGNPRKVSMAQNRSIEYVYSADGRKLRTVHSRAIAVRTKPKSGKMGGYRIEYIGDTTDYINNYVFKNGKPEMYRFKGGYYSFDEKGKLDACHYYVQDCQGNNRMVVNGHTNKVEQISHYYPYGALIGDISTQPEKQDFKYSGKELDRTYGLDLYDFHARQYDPLLPGFNSIDPKAEVDYHISPYVYCGGDPVNRVDNDGEIWNFIIGGVIGAAMDYACQVTQNAMEKGSLTVDCFTDNISLSSIGSSALEGVISGGASSIGSCVGKCVTKTVAKKAGSVVANIAGDIAADVTSEGVKAVVSNDYSFNVKSYVESSVLKAFPKLPHQQRISNNKAQKAAENKAIAKGNRLSTEEKKDARSKNIERNKHMNKTNYRRDQGNKVVDAMIDNGVDKYNKNDERQN